MENNLEHIVRGNLLDGGHKRDISVGVQKIAIFLAATVDTLYWRRPIRHQYHLPVSLRQISKNSLFIAFAP